jgi:hypothetical protein
MNRLILGLGTIACLGFSDSAAAANGSIAASMARDRWLASRRAEAQVKKPTVVAQENPAAPVTRPRADNPRPVR